LGNKNEIVVEKTPKALSFGVLLSNNERAID